MATVVFCFEVRFRLRDSSEKPGARHERGLVTNGPTRAQLVGFVQEGEVKGKPQILSVNYIKDLLYFI
jgi:hypothetical protein